MGFTVSSVHVEGLVHVERATFNAHMMIHEGDTVQPNQVTQTIKRLYRSGFFKNVQISRRGNALWVRVVERPIISFVGFSGQETLKREEIEKVLSDFKLTAGQIYQPEVLDRARAAIRGLYEDKSQYNATVEVKTKFLPRQQVQVNFVLNEGDVVSVRHIKFIGNQHVSQSVLLGEMDLSPHFWSFLSGNDHFSHTALQRDILKIQSYYLDHGYVDVQVLAPQTHFNADKSKVDLTLRIKEGLQYRLGHISLAPGTPHAKALKPLLKGMQSNQIYVRTRLLKLLQDLSDYFLERGYAHVRVKPVLNLDRAHQRVNVRFTVDPGPLVTVRAIRFFGNTITQDRVLRREFLQYESALFSSRLIQESVRRVNNLGYVRGAQCQPVDVTNRLDTVNLDCFVTEAPSISMGIAAGYGSQNGALFQLNFSHRSLFGTGYGVDFSATRMISAQSANIRLMNPYFTDSGVSQDFSLYVNRFTPSKNNISPYRTQGFGAILDYGIPIAATHRMTLGVGAKHTDVRLESGVADSIQDFVTAHGTVFNELAAHVGVSHDHLDEAIFPHTGTAFNLDAEVGLPIQSALRFFKVTGHANWFYPIAHSDWILQVNGGAGYGRSYGRYGTELPFFKNYFLGGIQTVRGFSANSLGPHDSKNRAIGGSVQAYASAAIILPQWFNEDVRLSVFLDGGGVGTRSIQSSNVRYSAGLAVQWRTALVPLVFSFALPLNKKSGDQKEFFAFELGTVL